LVCGATDTSWEWGTSCSLKMFGTVYNIVNKQVFWNLISTHQYTYILFVFNLIKLSMNQVKNLKGLQLVCGSYTENIFRLITLKYELWWFTVFSWEWWKDDPLSSNNPRYP
jgi:hypothetical protein